MKKSFIIVLVSAILITAAMAWLISSPNESNSRSQSTAAQNSKPEMSTGSQTESSNTANQTQYTATEVSSHKSPTDCWTIIENKVYDISEFIRQHPGGDNILSACGVDATAYFNGEKAGLNGGSNDHSNAARTMLDQYQIGVLTN